MYIIIIIHIHSYIGSTDTTCVICIILLWTLRTHVAFTFFFFFGKHAVCKMLAQSSSYVVRVIPFWVVQRFLLVLRRVITFSFFFFWWGKTLLRVAKFRTSYEIPQTPSVVTCKHGWVSFLKVIFLKLLLHFTTFQLKTRFFHIIELYLFDIVLQLMFERKLLSVKNCILCVSNSFKLG